MKPITLAIIMATVLIIASAFFLFIPSLIPSIFLKDDSNRIGIAQLMIETTSLIRVGSGCVGISSGSKEAEIEIVV